jgi:hypothetical protein
MHEEGNSRQMYVVFPVHVISASGSVVVVSMHLIATRTVMQNDVSYCIAKIRLWLSTVFVLPAFLVFRRLFNFQ